jgi:hypothetical protein
MKNVSDDTVTAAYNHFVEVFYPEGDLTEGKGMYFWKFLGMDHSPPAGAYPGWNLTDGAADRCHALAGPHYQAVAKMMTLRGYRYDLKVKAYSESAEYRHVQRRAEQP